MADLLGTSRESIGRWINGRGTPKRATLIAWASVTQVDLRWLETGETQPAPDPDQGPTPGVSLPRLDSNQQPSGYVLPLVRRAA